MAENKEETKTLRQPTFVSISDLEKGRSGYNVYVKVVECQERQITTRDDRKIKMVDAVVADDTGSAKAFFKAENAEHIQKGATIAIRNGVKKIIKGHISLELDIFGRVTLENKDINPKTDVNISDAEIKFDRKDRQRRPRNQPRNRGNDRNRGARNNNRSVRNDRNERNERNDRKRGERGERGERRQEDRAQRRNRDDDRRGDRKPRNQDRDYDRKPRNEGTKGGFQEKSRNEGRFQEKRGDRKPMIKINEIGPGEQNLRFIAKIISATLVSGKNGSNIRCVLGDETGVVNAFIPESEHLVVGKTAAFFGAEARVVKEHIEIQRARVEPARNPIDRVKESFNLSEKAWVPVD